MQRVGKSVNTRLCLGAAGALSACAVAFAVWTAISASAAIAGTDSDRPIGTQPIRYGRDIRPILSDRCFACHGQDPATRAAELRLDTTDGATARKPPYGLAAIVPGQPQQSLLWRRITSDNPDFQMPPPDSNMKPLSEQERDLIRRWIEQGAEYEPHWSFVPPMRPDVPAVENKTWCSNPIDRFILQRLEQEGITPSLPADRETLIRRVFLDLTGLPPTPEEIDAFLADERPDAYERWLDRLMTEEPYRTRYAERMAVPWLDAARYADTSGIHMDAGRQMWLWRDWVIQAYRDNMPFDRFVIEQIAGDLLPEATVEQKIASGFNRNHVTTDEGGAIDEEYRVEYVVDRANTTGSVFLGLTVGCARCHDHKYDPISQEEYFGLYAFFNSIDEPGLYSQSPDPQRALEPFIIVPTKEQEAQLTDLRGKIAQLAQLIESGTAEQERQYTEFEKTTREKLGVSWSSATLTEATSANGATLTIQDDNSFLASGENPEKDEHVLTLQTDAAGLRLLSLEALADPSLPDGRVGRAPNGNAVLTAVKAEAVSIQDPARKESIRFLWAWADHEQANGDFRVSNILTGDGEGWAVAGHERAGGRVAVLLSEKPFGFEGGTQLHVRLQYKSVYAQHVFGRVRVGVGSIAKEGVGLLPAAVSNWYITGPFQANSADEAYMRDYGPHKELHVRRGKGFGDGKRWAYDANVKDGVVFPLPEGVNTVYYFGRRVFSPTPRRIEVSLGSDDGFALFVNGKQVAARSENRPVAADQDKAAIDLNAGLNALVIKIVNTSGPGGFFHRALPRSNELPIDLAALLLPGSAPSGDFAARMRQAWKMNYLPEYREQSAQLAALNEQVARIEASQPRTMIMKELAQPRETFVLTRGQYDKPDKNRPVARSIPAILGRLPDDAPRDRLGLAQWLTSPENPLVARVAVNRYWEMLFGTGIVATSEDFGLQGDWPTHPELLDWLAVEFRESGWNVQHILRLIMTSSTYRQQSIVRPELRDRDPGNRLLAWFPRRRLPAEFIRDQALYVSGLLVEKVGGPSVKPYQPPGLWKEVAMIQSNTREYVRGNGPELWRRSMYTYWKRACPPPSMMVFDAPTREACTIRRSNTNTPLQALVLWNDEQFVEAARVLATRLRNDKADAAERAVRLYRTCTGRPPDATELERLLQTLDAFLKRYQAAPEDAARLLDVGEAPLPDGIDKPELAAWTMLANAVLNLSETITQR
ncbi:MAG TPA: PSD1 and planctomycete cytochrome C domain-containing protein [Phycisphaerae bacterium]|nr:PSD1 and planctomycete cytochrome C domain-containing protein [Phycisphaerae bacterium]